MAKIPPLEIDPDVLHCPCGHEGADFLNLENRLGHVMTDEPNNKIAFRFVHGRICPRCGTLKAVVRNPSWTREKREKGF
jgi:hypothetical protein